jgi:DNA modification methylase
MPRFSGLNNSVLNKVATADAAAHDWYRFVLSFPPHLVRDYVRRFELTESDCVLDPFCGTGTTNVECKKLGIPSVGIEAHPMAHFASKVKVAWNVDPEELKDHADQIAESARRRLVEEGFSEDKPLFSAVPEDSTSRALVGLRTLPEPSETLLLRDSISPVPLHKTLVLLDVINEFRNHRVYEHELLALAKALVTSISNLHFGPEVGVGRFKKDASVVGSWLLGIREICSDLMELGRYRQTPAYIYKADARQLERLLKPASISAVITSPPYPNEKDYTRTTRLESVVLGFIKNKEDLKELKRQLLRSNTRTVYKSDDDDRWVASHKEIQRIAETIEARRIQLGKTSGFERLYHRVTKLYFGGIARHFAQLRKALRPGAYLAYVVGDQASYLRVMIRTGQLLADVAKSLGFEVVGIDLFRTRLASATKEQLREEVVVLRWPSD